MAHTLSKLIGILVLASALPANAADLYTALPEGWQRERVYNTSLPSDDNWWKKFDDPVLDSLIYIGEENNLNLKSAARRIEMARRNWNAVKGGYSPTIGATAGWTKSRTSGDMEPGGAVGNVSYFSLGLNFNWEVDLFGRIHEQSKQARGVYNASRAEYEVAMISLCGNIATAYFNYRLADAEIGVAIEEITSQEKLVAITEARHEAGLVSKLDVAQAKTMLYTTRATMPALEATREAALNSIAMLLGCYADAIRPLVEEARELPAPYHIVETGVPADLLRRRPDIAEAEAEIAQYAAALGIARKDWLPTLSITGSIGTSARNAKDLFTDKSLTYSVAPQLSWTIFDGLIRDNRIASAREQLMMSVDNYNEVVINAVTEVENSMTSYTSSLTRLGLQKEVNKQSSEALTLALDRYKRGLDSFINVMDAQVTVLDNRNAMLELEASTLNTLVKLYTSLCGAPEGRD